MSRRRGPRYTVRSKVTQPPVVAAALEPRVPAAQWEQRYDHDQPDQVDHRQGPVSARRGAEREMPEVRRVEHLADCSETHVARHYREHMDEVEMHHVEEQRHLADDQ